MHYRQQIDACFEATLGVHGIVRARLDALLTQLESAHTALASRANKAAAPILNIVNETADLTNIQSLADNIAKRFDTIVLVGSGGSSMSGCTLIEFLPFAPKQKFHFLDNVDPDAMEKLLYGLNVKTTCFIIISKSGSTVETLAQFFTLLSFAEEKLGAAVASHFITITMKGDNPLRRIAAKRGFTTLDHPADIGGRFSIFTSVGLLPAAIAGLDIAALRQGAAAIVSELAKNPTAQLAPAIGAALQYAFIEKQYNLNVMLPYAQRLSGFSSWYRQCWAESLGKDGKGSTPIRAVGTTDQHSQLQLYLSGPKDKLFHMIAVKKLGKGQRVATDDPALAYIHGRTLGDILQAEQQATYETLLKNQCPVRLFELDTLDEQTLGALLMHFMLEIMFVAALQDINPFDQPAVEDGKILAKTYLERGIA